VDAGYRTRNRRAGEFASGEAKGGWRTDTHSLQTRLARASVGNGEGR
jgi:hypothetical protein